MTWFRDGTRLIISGAIGPDDHQNGTTSIYVVSILSGNVRKLITGGMQVDLSPDESMMVVAHRTADRGTLSLADADGSNLRPFAGGEPGEVYWSPAFSVDGKRVVYRKERLGTNRVSIESRTLDGGDPIVLLSEEHPPDESVEGLERFLAEDFLVFEDRLVFARDEPAPRRDRNLWQLAIDPGSGEPRGEPRRLTDWVGLEIKGLSATADGATLVFRDDHNQTDVLVGELGERGRALREVRRLTLDDRDDRPLAWTLDSGSVVFASDRNGDTDLFVQEVGSQVADDFVVAPQDQPFAWLSPDGNYVVYVEVDPSGRKIWQRAPARGGPKETIEEGPWKSTLLCPTVEDRPCVLWAADPLKQVVAWNWWDPETGKGDELRREPLDPAGPDLSRQRMSPDGTRIAVPFGNSILVHDLPSWTTTEIVVDQSGGIIQLAWAPDASGFYVAATFAALYHVDLEGHATELLTAPEFLGLREPTPSPDGRYLAFEQATRESNVWLVEDF